MIYRIPPTLLAQPRTYIPFSWLFHSDAWLWSWSTPPAGVPHAPAADAACPTAAGLGSPDDGCWAWHGNARPTGHVRSPNIRAADALHSPTSTLCLCGTFRASTPTPSPAKSAILFRASASTWATDTRWENATKLAICSSKRSSEEWANQFWTSTCCA